MTECRCRMEAADYRKKCRCRTNFSPAFTYDFQYHITRIKPSAAVYGRAECISFHYLQFGRALGIPFHHHQQLFSMRECRTVRYRYEQKFRCRNQSGTGIMGSNPVSDLRMPECRWHQPRCPAMTTRLLCFKLF